MPHRPLQHAQIMASEIDGQGWFTIYPAPLVLAQQITAQHWREGESHHGGSTKGCDESDAQWCQQTPLHATEKEERNKTHNDNQCGIEDGHTHLARSFIDHVQLHLDILICSETVFAQALIHILHIHDGIIHQRTDGNGHTAQTHGVDGEPHQMKRKNTDHQRERNSDQ